MARQWLAHRPGGLEVFELVEVEVSPPGPGEVTVRVRAAGLNPADAKHVAQGLRPNDFPRPVGYEVAGVVTAIGPDTELASGGGAVGDEVLAFRVRGGWTTELTIPARDVFAKPPSLSFEQAANLLLAGTTAAEMLHLTHPNEGETALVHGASGAVGVMLLQQAALRGIRVVGTASPARFEVVRRYGGEPVAYGDGLEERVRAAAPDGVAVALDCIGTDEALAVSLALVPDRSRMVSIAGPDEHAEDHGYHRIGGGMPAS
jgi:NADPH:quinone reductase